MCLYVLQYIYIVYIAYIADNLLQCRATETMRTAANRSTWRRSEREGGWREVPTGRMSNKQKLLKIIVAYLADSRGMPQTRRQGGSAGGQRHCCLLLGASKATHKCFSYPANGACCMWQAACWTLNNQRKTHIIYLVLPPYQWSSTVRMSNILYNHLPYRVFRQLI